MIHVLRVDPSQQIASAALTGMLAKRVLDYAEAHQPDVDPYFMVSTVMARLWSGHRDLLLLALVDGERIVGHVVANFTAAGEKKYATILQSKFEGNVQDAPERAYDHVGKWASEMGATTLQIVTHKNPKHFEKYGFDISHSLLVRSLVKEGV